MLFSTFNNTFSQNRPKIIKQATYLNVHGDQSSNANDHTEDWLFEVIEDSYDKGIVSCGFSDGPHHGDNSGRKKQPAVIKTDKRLNFLWRYDLSDNQTIYDYDNTTCNVILDDGVTRCYDIIDVNDYYYVIALIKVKKTLNQIDYFTGYRPLLMKFSKNGTMQNLFPRIIYNTNYNNISEVSSSVSFRGMTVDYDKDKIILAGAYNSTQYAAIYNLNSGLITSSQTFNEGLFNDVCPIYNNGSKTKKMPVVNNQAPISYAFVGFNRKCNPCFVGNTDATDGVIIRTNLSLTSPVEKSFNASNLTSSDYNPDYDRGIGGDATCPDETETRNSNDLAMKVEQLTNGKILIGMCYNYLLLIDNSFNLPFNFDTLCIESKHREQIIHTDAFIVILDNNFTSSTTPTRHDHVAHLNGDDFEFSVTQDLTGNKIIGTGTIADDYRLSISGQMDEYWVFKYDPNYNGSSGNIEWEFAASGCGRSHVCGFDIIPTFNGGIVCVGNNHRNGENFDIMLLGKDCETNVTVGQFDFLPNMPDGKTFSIQKFLNDIGSTSTTLNTFQPRNVLAQVRVESGYTWILNYGCTLNFLNPESLVDSARTSDFRYSIIVESGATFEMKPNTKVTSLDYCMDALWGGIKLEENSISGVQNGGRFIMKDAIIENAILGVTCLTGATMLCENTPMVGSRPTISNFKNCRKSVEIYPWNSSTTNNIVFKYVNFLCDAPIHDYNNECFTQFISSWDLDGIKIWGSSFKNTYTGNFFGNARGMGISTFNVSADIIKGSDLTTTNGQCSYPIGTTNLFEGLDVGFWNGGNTNSNILRIYGNEFKNVANPVYAGTGSALKLYDNDFYWNNNFIQPPSGHPNYWVKGIHTANVEGLDFDQNRLNAQRYLYPYTAMFIENVNDISTPSIIYNNKTWNNPNTGLYGTAMFNSNSNEALDFVCNTYENMLQDWHLGNNFRPTVGQSGMPGNNNKWTKPSTISNNILKNSGTPLTYYNQIVNPNILPTPNISNSSLITRTSNGGVPERDCNNTSPCVKYNYSAEHGGEHLGEMRVFLNQEYFQALDALNKQDFNLAREKANSINTNTENYNKKTLLNIIIPIFEQKRQFEMNSSEIQNLMALTIGNEHENEYARNVLTFFAGISFEKSIINNNTSELNLNNKEKIINYNLVSMYPNPTNDKINVEINENVLVENFKIIIYDILGVKQIEYNLTNSNTLVDLSSLTNGIYTVSVYKNNELISNNLVSKF